MSNSFYTLNYNQIYKMKKIKEVIKQHKDELTDYEMITLHDLLYFVSKNQKALTCNQKLIKLFNQYNVPMVTSLIDKNVQIIHEGAY